RMVASIEANKRHQLGTNGAAAHAMPEDWARGSGGARADQGPIGFSLGRLLFAGTPDTVVEQIQAFHAATGVGVLDFIFTAGNPPREAIRRGIELFGQEVLPRIRGIGDAASAANAATAARA